MLATDHCIGRIILLVAVAFPLTLAAEVSSAEEQDSVSTRTRAASLYESRLRDDITALLIRDPEIRLNRVKESLGYGSGENVQVLRLLCWAMEPEPSIRKEVLTQWLCEKETIPDAGEVMREMENVTHAHTPADVATRRGEIETVLAGLDKEKIVRQERRNRRMQSPNVVLKGSTGCRGLDRLAARHLSEKFLGSNLFYADAPGRAKIYESLPWPDIWLEGGNRVCRTFYALLYSFEPDPILRRRILLPRIEVTAGRFEAGEDEDFWLKILDPVLACLDDGEKEMRRAEMMAMKPPILTQRAKEERRRAFEMHEERIRRIHERYETQKATDPTSPTSPTLP